MSKERVKKFKNNQIQMSHRWQKMYWDAEENVNMQQHMFEIITKIKNTVSNWYETGLIQKCFVRWHYELVLYLLP
jgi:hypothetical protein